MDGVSRTRPGYDPRRGQGLRSISHLYLSSSPRNRQTPVAAARRTLRLGIAGCGDRLAKTEVCANLAVQMARLGLRTLVVDLDPMLPNTGFQLGLEPAAYMAHLLNNPGPVLERGVLGMRILEGIAATDAPRLPPAVAAELSASHCVLVNLPEPSSLTESHRDRLGAWIGSSAPSDAAGNGGAPARPGAASPPLDAVVCVLETGEASAAALARAGALTSDGVRVVAWGDGAHAGATQPWARLPPGRPRSGTRQPLSALEPEHPVARAYEGLAQSLLAGCGRRGGG